ncbi:heme A synthase [Bacillus cereus group sp. Bc222]|uniref:COX15/CtaA family protein n=1 Tax=Bacillus cereus group sp. Bc222 TaxID=3018111 RepID=UPI0022DFEC3E|nr:heme A synthase [Bacillus cereus group sp. Bc222]MDA2241732.1 heme A synthase [Bacillus cereus group sp. Bc222]
MQRFIKWLAIITSIDLLCVLLGGVLVTKTGSQQGCGKSWPLCNGELIPSNLSMETIIELSHRLVSGSAGILVTILCILSWKYYSHVREIMPLTFLSILFLIAQALLGAAAVIWGQVSTVLALHFGISLISFASVFLLTILIFEVDKKCNICLLSLDKKMQFHIYGVTIYCYLVVYSGALVRHAHASLSCPDFPFCSKNRWFPLQYHEWVQMGHRIAAIILAYWILYATMLAIRQYKDQTVLQCVWITCSIIVTLQGFVGILVIYTRMNLYMSLLHSFFISCLFALLCYLVMLSVRSNNHKGSVVKFEKTS